MMCEKAAQVHAYYDNELDATHRRMVELHLERCEECRQLLWELKELAALISESPKPEASEQAMARFEGAWLTGIAAMLLVGALLTVPERQGVAPVKPGLWEAMAVTPPAETQSESNSELVQVAQWMADDLSMGGRQGR
jgi:hypothetical protein